MTHAELATVMTRAREALGKSTKVLLTQGNDGAIYAWFMSSGRKLPCGFALDGSIDGPMDFLAYMAKAAAK